MDIHAVKPAREPESTRASLALDPAEQALRHELRFASLPRARSAVARASTDRSCPQHRETIDAEDLGE